MATLLIVVCAFPERPARGNQQKLGVFKRFAFGFVDADNFE